MCIISYKLLGISRAFDDLSSPFNRRIFYYINCLQAANK